MRITKSIPRKKRKSKILKLAAGFRGRKKNCYGLAIDMVVRKLKYQYRDRRRIKRQMRSLWIQRINAAARLCGTSYSRLIPLLNENHITLNRKSLAEIAARDFPSFQKIVASLA
jgi:large subunit ribosomal protein L20